MTSAAHLATLECTTLRTPPAQGGHVADPVEHLTGLRCMPLDPVSDEILLTQALADGYQPLKTIVFGKYDIKEGDWLRVGGKSYPIRGYQRMDWLTSEYHVLIVEAR